MATNIKDKPINLEGLKVGLDTRVKDVQVNGQSVVTEGIASVTVPKNVSDLSDGGDYVKSSDIEAKADLVGGTVPDEQLPYSIATTEQVDAIFDTITFIDGNEVAY